jgi:hypothetical protein
MEQLYMDAWPYFPGLKVGTIYFFSSFLIIWWRFMTYSAEYDYYWAMWFTGTVFLWPFLFFPVRVH